MKIAVQTDNISLLREVIHSNCSAARFGSEFCEYNMPSLDRLEKAYEIVRGEGKEFTYVTPRLSNDGIEKVRRQIVFLSEKGEVRIVVNDLGALNMLKRYPNLVPYLGRQLIRTPARSPWVDEIAREGGILARGWYGKIFSSTSLNYPLKIKFFQTYGVKGADVDLIPCLFPSFDFLTKMGLDLFVHLHLRPVTVTRRCHTARFLGEKNPERCSKPCLEKAFMLKNDLWHLELFLHGNAVFSFAQPRREDLRKLERKNITFVLSMNPVTGMDDRRKINDFVRCYSS